jgi:hypothetical protein
MSLIRPHSRRLALPAVLLLGALTCAPAARADIGETIIQRCTHGESLGGFSQNAYRKALKELSADAEEYTNCAQLIRQAQLAAASGRGGGPAAGEAASAVAATPVEKQAVKRAASSGSAPVSVGGQLVKPGVVHADISSALSSLPAPLLALLALLLACAVVLGGARARDRIRPRGHRRD